MTALVAEGLVQSAGDRRLLDDVSLRLEPGEIVGLVGPNGAGKSTLIRALLGQSAPDRGRVTLGGQPVRQMAARARAARVAYVPQRAPEGFPVSVFDTCLLGRTPHMSARPTAHDIAVTEAMLDRLRLSDLAFRGMDALSGGERQRVMLARALVQETPLILLDEPTSALDIGNQLFTLRLLSDLVAETGRGVLVAIHDLSLAARFAARLVLMDAGRVIATGDWREALSPAHIRASYGVETETATLRGVPVIAPFEPEETP